MDYDFNKDMEYDSYFDEYVMEELKQDNDMKVMICQDLFYLKDI